MIPPRLASHLQNLITRKLLESSAFNEFVARTDGVFHSIRLGLKEGWEEENQESSKQGTSSSHDDHYQQKNSQPKQPHQANQTPISQLTIPLLFSHICNRSSQNILLVTGLTTSIEKHNRTRSKQARHRAEAQRVTRKASSSMT
ncbi:hypothetical protein H4Q26_010217 [Puccinia striiformis f. sp. tritici PST-130]|nr:hypothetical protein H4Q26_010217 [Puccinia striiformis f. sp. tritici PST-130]